MELLDYFDAEMDWIGVASRSEVHKKGYWHKTFHCWILRKEDDKRNILFQKRSAEKAVHPNKFDISAAGHFLAGETASEGARELAEELGLRFQMEDLFFLGIRKDCSMSASQINNEFCHTYLYFNNAPLTSYKLQREEVSALIEVEIEDVRRLIAGEVDSIYVAYYQEDESGILESSVKNICREDFVPHPDMYYLQILEKANRYLDGEKELSI